MDESRTPAEIVEGMERDRARATSAVTPNMVLLNAVWGAFWLFGPLLLFLAFLPGSALPIWLAVTVSAVLFAGAMTVGVVVGVRSGSGLAGPSSLQGGIFGAANGVGFLLTVLIGLRLMWGGASPQLLLVFFPAASCLVLGILYFAAAAIFNDRANLAMGVVIILATVGGIVAPTPYNLLVIACVAGCGFVALVVIAAMRPRALLSTLWPVHNG